MSRKRKHEQDSIGPEKPRKRAALDKNKPSSSSLLSSLPIISHPVLSVYFPVILTLRDYFSTTLSQRRTTRLELAASNDTELETLLNTTVVGYHPSDQPAQNIKPDIIAATQQSGNTDLSQPEVIKLALHLIFRQARKSPSILIAGRPHPTRLYDDNDKLPNHVLAFGHRVVEGQRKSSPFQTIGLHVANEYPNTAVNMLRRPVWGRVLERVGVEAMVALVVGRCVFMPLGGEGTEGRYYQVSGPPISYKINNPPAMDPKNGKSGSRNQTVDNGTAGVKMRDPLTPGAVEFFRRRVMHANAAHNKHGVVKFGLHHNHALNRFADDAETLLMYIFPREYKLHNVFTSEINRRHESAPVRDYTSRDEEIAALQKKYEGGEIPIPKRLQTRALQLARKLQKRHEGCSYHALVKFYCPQVLCDPGVKDTRAVILSRSETAISTTLVSSGIKIQPNVLNSSEIYPTPGAPKILQEKEILHKPCFTDFANPPGQVCAFVRAVINTVIPHDFFGTPENRETVLKAIDVFIRLRRRETLSIHHFLQGLKLTAIPWLAPDSLQQAQKLAKPDAQKRLNLLAEFLYYLVDSFLIPLLRSNFYVTESSTESNRLFFFRHDVWRKLTEPQLERLKMEMFRPVPEAAVKRLVEEAKDPRVKNSRGALDVVRWRLTPKEAGVRMIMNLGRRKLVEKYNFKYFEKSINDRLKPINYVLTYETTQNPSLLGSSMFTPDTLYPRLKSFRASLRTHSLHQQPLYFVKLDIKSCFDTIPQTAILDYISDVLTSEEYRVMRHEVMLPKREISGDGRKGKWVTPFVKVVQRARDADDDEGFEGRMRREKVRTGSVVVDGGAVKKIWEKEELEVLLRRHVKTNVVKIGKKYYTQKTGIPQGSTISTMLCNLFYAHLETQHLSFLHPLSPCSSKPPRSLLARMTDDFLLITLDRDKAQRFLKTMHTGIAAYGATVNPDKTLVNFDTTVGGRKIRSLSETSSEGGGGLWFPYCGLMIHTRSLEVRKQRDRKKVNVVKDTITIKTTPSPGRALILSTLTAFKARLHPALFDTTFNSRATVVNTLYHRFIETAMKFHCHVKMLDSITSATRKKKIGVNPAILKRAITVLCADVYAMLKSRAIRAEKRARDEDEGWECSVLDEGFVKWLGLHAFAKVLGRKQSRYRGSGLVEWVKEEEGRVRRGGGGWVGVRGLGRGEFARWKY